MPYEYTPVKGRRFRLIHLPPGHDDVYVEISVEDLANNECRNHKPYEALSWQWGKEDPQGGNVIYIRNARNEECERTCESRHEEEEFESGYEPMPVRPNLLWALKRIRQCYHGFKPFWLWVDFICINQANIEERQEQVQWMTEIYGNARRVHVWLGKPGYPVDAGARDNIVDEELETAVQHIKSLGKLDDANHLGSVDIGIRNKASLHNLEPLFKLLKSGWFGRRWIVQEVGVAKRATVHCGDKQFSWEELTHAVALLETIGRDGSIDRLFKLRPDTRHVSEYAGNISALPAYRLIQNVSGLYRGLANQKRSEARSLEQLVCYLVVFECSEPRDVIYAVLGIASDVRPISPSPRPDPVSRNQTSSDECEPFEVDYNEDILKVYTRFLEHAIKKSGSLDILCRPWAPANILTKENPPKTIKLPSWILDATHKPFRATARRKMVRYNPDPFVGPAVSRGSFYTASGRYRQKDESVLVKIDPKAITVRGFELGKPSKIWDLAVHGSIPASWLKGANWFKASKPPPDELWRTLVADRTNAGIEPEPEYPSVIHQAVLEKGVEYGINTNEFLHETDNAAYYEVFRRVQAVVWNRKLIRAKLDDEYGMEPCLGLVPAETRESDSIYIVGGCSVPLVLRKRSASGTQRTEYDKKGKGKEENTAGETEIYELIGECYINNMMDGRAIKGRSSPLWRLITIE
ncbi:heterokaryon incompatibility protein-domain-containing protein [Xylaria cubensis]|nr:heterokaryon incompatibility protein-domain-containing protein [Xylaria cubensis]